MNIKDCAFYFQGINGFKGYENNKIIEMEYGKNKSFYFRKQDAYKLFLAILGKEELVDTLKVTEEKFNEYVAKGGIINVLESNLVGRGVVFVTEFKNYLEYTNSSFNNLKGITGLDINGNIIAKDTSELFQEITDEQRYEIYSCIE